MTTNLVAFVILHGYVVGKLSYKLKRCYLKSEALLHLDYKLLYLKEHSSKKIKKSIDPVTN